MRLFPPTFGPWQVAADRRAVAVLMSGGVDSSVTAALLQEAGWQVLGVTLKIPSASSGCGPSSCCGAEAALVCRQLGVPHYFVEVREEFEALIIEPFREAYAHGLTPNPCVNCNTFLKFGLLWDCIEQELGIEHVATGHYARVETSDNSGGTIPVSSEVVQQNPANYPGNKYGVPRITRREAVLRRAVDHAKDQSYFLYGIPARRLPYLILPLGDKRKEEVRRLARARGLTVAEKAESMELCFTGENDYRQGLAKTTAPSPGPVFDQSGQVVGQHHGIHDYTIGQRRGLPFAAGHPVYVTHINPADNSITVGTREEASTRTVAVHELNLLLPTELAAGAHLFGKIRSRGEPEACTVTEFSEERLVVDFDLPQFAPTPGQHLVLYDAADRVVGGGVITS